MKKPNARALKRFWMLAKLYWFEERQWQRLLWLGAVTVLLIVGTVMLVRLNAVRGGWTNALDDRDAEAFWAGILQYVLIIVAYVPLVAGQTYLISLLGLKWRTWMTERFVGRYLDNRAYYKLTSKPDIDNPDQRISQDIKGFTYDALIFLLVIINSVFQLVGFGGQLWGISRVLVLVLVIYTIFGTFLATGVFGRVLVRLNAEQLRREADFRFGLVRIRENAEAIAFYQGEGKEEGHLKLFFNEIVENFKRLIVWRDVGFGTFDNGYEWITYAVPVMVLAPSVFAGDYGVGEVVQAQSAFLRIFFALNLIIRRFESLTEFAAGIDRVYDLAQAMDDDGRERGGDPGEVRRIDTVEGERIAIEHLTLQTPNYQRTLLTDLSFTLPARTGLLVMGASGAGKSSLLRAIAGLWTAGTGRIERPPLSEVLFVPQRPYMTLGTLREQLLYPDTEANYADARLQAVLEQVNLPNLVEQYGGFEAVRNWSEVLSLGEQQRLAFARVLLQQTRFAILDESTSALDVANEGRLYEHLQQAGVTYISVGHRPTLRQYHQHVLEVLEDESWHLQSGSNGSST